MKIKDYEKGEIGLKGGRGRKRREWWTICDMKAEMETIAGKKLQGRNQQEEAEVRGEQ